jgi:hypothetical protein
MGKLVFAAGAAGVALLAACNMLSGADSLTAEQTGIEQPVNQTPHGATSGSSGVPSSSGSSGEPARPGHDMTSSSSSSSGSTEVGPDDAGLDASGEAAAALPTFFDDFARADGTIGNGWIEKAAGKYGLIAGAAQQKQNGIYRNGFVSRPAAENAVDVLLQAKVTFPVATADPCIFARIQPGSDAPNTFYAYSAYPDGANNFYVSRDDGNTFTDMGSSIISPPLVVGETYRISLQVTGTNPVHLVGSLSKPDGTVLASVSANDASPKRIMTAGSVGFGSSASLNGRWDDFHRVTLAP